MKYYLVQTFGLGVIRFQSLTFSMLKYRAAVMLFEKRVRNIRKLKSHHLPTLFIHNWYN